MNATTIYTLSDPRSGEVRYVGKTTKSLKVRIANHVSRAKCGENRYTATWIRSLPTRPVIKALAIVENELGSETEIRLIALLRGRGYRLTNLTEGGEGALGLPSSRKGQHLSAEHRANIGAAKIGHTHTAETKAKLAIAARIVHTGRKRPAETSARISAALMGRSLSPEHRAKLKGNQNSKGVVPSQETRARISLALMGNKNCVGNINSLGYHHTADAKAKITAANHRRWARVRLTKEKGTTQ